MTDEACHEPVDRALIDLDRRALLDDLALVHDRDDIGHGQGLELVVRDIDRGDAKALDEFAQLDPDLFPELGVEIAQRLVQQQDLRLLNQRTGQRQALLLSAAKERRRPALEAAQLHHFERLAHLLADLGLGETSGHLLQREGRVLEHRHVGSDRVGMKHHADVALIGWHGQVPSRRVDDLVADCNLAVRRRLETGQGA